MAESIRTTQLPVPTQAPAQPLNDRPAAGTAVNVTAVPAGKSREHDERQSTPAGAEVTRPSPLTVSVSA